MAVGFWLAVAILIGIGVATHQSNLDIIRTGDRIKRARHVIENLPNIRFALQDAEQQTRELIKTDDMTHQDARLLAAVQVNGAFNRLRKASADWPAQGHQDIAALEILAGDRLRLLDEAVQLRNTQDRAAAIQLLDTDQSRALVSQIDASIYALMETEQHAFIARDDELKAKAHFSVALFVLGCFVSLGILSGVFLYLNVQIDARRAAETALAREKALLEQQYRRQTALAKIEFAINQPHELKPALEQIVRAVVELMPSDDASVILWDTGAPQSVVNTGQLPATLKDQATRWIAEHKQTLIVPAIGDDLFGTKTNELGAYAGVPLLLENDVLGVLYALDRKARQYRGDEMDFLESLAARAALAISKVRLYDRLQDINRLLESRVHERTVELIGTNERLLHEVEERLHAEQALHDLSGRLLQLQDQERRHIARELHDVTAQNLSAITLNLARLENILAGADPKALPVINESIHLAEDCLREIRTLSYVLHPPMLDEYGLPRALEWYLDGFATRSGIRVELHALPTVGRLPEETEMALFRVVQEGLTNIRRHAGSQHASIQLTRDDGFVILEIKDDGHGFPKPAETGTPPPAVQLGVGITGMRERLRQLGGQLDVESSATGTIVRAVVPMKGNET